MFLTSNSSFGKALLPKEEREESSKEVYLFDGEPKEKKQAVEFKDLKKMKEYQKIKRHPKKHPIF